MNGSGRFSDNIFVERLWRSLKYEEVYLKAYARAGIPPIRILKMATSEAAQHLDADDIGSNRVAGAPATSGRWKWARVFLQTSHSSIC